MQFAIVSNCQGDGLAACMRAINPDIGADFIFITEIHQGRRTLADVFARYDQVFGNLSLIPDVPPEAAGRFTPLPSIVFPAFHPDMTYVTGVRRGSAGEVEAVHNAMVGYHSCLVLGGHRRGLGVADIVALFNDEVCARLGYADQLDDARQALLEEGVAAGLPLDDALPRWLARGCFMYSMNHPQLPVLADVARALLTGAGVPIRRENVATYLEDPLRVQPIWPLYPAVARRFGLHGDYTFMRPVGQGPLTLEQFVTDSVAHLDAFERDSLKPALSATPDWEARLRAVLDPPAPRARSRNPYAGLPRVQFWRDAVAEVAPDALDPVVNPRLWIGRDDRIATAGSCFAQHIARALSGSGFHYLVAEAAPDGMEAAAAAAANYGVFSARFGNVYTVRQLVQLLQRADGAFVPEEDAWTRPDGRLVDPFRPQVEPAGFADRAALTASRDVHLAAVRAMLREMDVFVFTLGLTEGWRSRADGAVYPLAPGVAGGEMDASRYEFVNFTVAEVIADLEAAVELIARVNPACHVILTVSPVPLIATYEPRHALVATTYSKAVLRVAADTVSRAHGHVEYFPSYEIITGAHAGGRYYEADLRSIAPEGVAHVMRVFMGRYTTEPAEVEAAEPDPAPPMVGTGRRRALFDVVCDEEAIARA